MGKRSQLNATGLTEEQRIALVKMKEIKQEAPVVVAKEEP